MTKWRIERKTQPLDDATFPGESPMLNEITYRSAIERIDWVQMKTLLMADSFDNGRSPEQLRKSFENSYAAVVAYHHDVIVGTARVISDGICNAYIVDVWTHSAHRRRGIARTMLARLEARLEGQHVYLFSDNLAEFYEKLGYRKQPTGLSKVIGRWLENDTRQPTVI
jgi:predicted GNAT family acetyltransferase